MPALNGSAFCNLVSVHTRTGEWQSFEVRMRRRKVERLLLRADIAAEADCLDHAMAALEEARALDPSSPDIPRIEARIAALADRPQPARATGGTVSTRRAAAWIIGTAAALIVVGAQLPPAGPGAPTSTPASGSAPVQQAAALPAAAPTPSPSRPLDVEMDRVHAATTSAIAAAPRTQPRTPAPDATAGRADERREPVVSVPQRAAPAHTPPEPAPTVVAAATDARVGLPNAFPVRPADVPVLPPPSHAPALEAAPNDTLLVRNVLDRYADAYTRLDARAAQQAWPSVDRDALARAFDDLASQAVSLGRCDVNVTGATATAACLGTASWTPKVGGGAHTDPRMWTFELARATTGWRIVNARVQKR